MSSINNQYAQYQQISSQATSQVGSVRHHHHQHSSQVQEQNSSLAVSDQVSISSDGMQALQEERMKNHHVSPLDDLVKNGTLTEDQKSAIEEAFKTARAERTATSSDGSNLTAAEAAGAQGTTAPIDPLESLVSNGTLTEDQRDAIKTALDAARPKHGRPDGPPPNGAGGPPPGGKAMDKALNGLVSDGTLTEDQKTAVQKTLLAMIEAMKDDGTTSTSDSDSSVDLSTTLAEALDNTSTNNSSSSRKNFMDEILNQLVEKGTLTEDQKNAVTQSFQNLHPVWTGSSK